MYDKTTRQLVDNSPLTTTLVIDANDEMTVVQSDDRQDRRLCERQSPPLALYWFGDEGANCADLLSHTTSGNMGLNNTLMHVEQDDLPFGGIGPSGTGAYYGVEGFRSMSHAEGVFI